MSALKAAVMSLLVAFSLLVSLGASASIPNSSETVMLTTSSNQAGISVDGSSPPRSIQRSHDVMTSTTTVNSDAVSADTIHAVVVRSWGACSSESLIWDSLNATWSNYGTTPININYAHADLCGGPVTYDKLVASEADVVIISDPAGGLEQYSADEVSALRQYAQDGHALIGTFMLLQWRDFDNRGLAPLFGLASGVAFNPTERVLQNTNSR